ncbi:MAG TPA: hypothetical protein DDW36_04395 [Candidatus Magasanikbacteria bacterium]|nr:hypothetical protein [Candidatus Magasanikbacteria bacterium]
MKFKLQAPYKPSGDQPQAIEELVDGLKKGYNEQTLLGVTGSGKSVISKTPVLIKKEGVTMNNIGEFIDQLLMQHRQQIRYVGDTEILDAYRILQKYETYSLNTENKQTSWKYITQFVRHRSPTRLYTVEAACGRSVTVTGDHNFFVLRNGFIQLVTTIHLKDTDYIPLPRIIETHNQPLTHIFLASYVSDPAGLFVSIPAFPVVWNTADSTLKPLLDRAKVFNIAHHQERISWDVFKTIQTIDPRISTDARLGLKFKKYQAPLEQPITKELLRLLGYYIAEGHAENRYLTFSTSESEILDDFTTCVQSIGLHCRKRQKIYDYVVVSKLWSCVVRTLCGGNSKTKCLPHFWPQLSCEQLAELLKAYFAGDGCAERNVISCTTASKQLASDIMYALLRFGIIARMRLRKIRLPNRNEYGTYWTVCISGQQNLSLYVDNIGFSLKRKQQAALQIIKQYGNTNVDVIPINPGLFKKIRLKLALLQKDVATACGVERSYISMLEHQIRRPSREIFERLISYFKDRASAHDNREVLDVIRQIAPLSNCYWTPVKDIVKKEGRGYVYDFAVQDNETFFAGDGGLFVHNTFTMANVIERTQLPTLVIAHNKTLAAQLCNEFREFFPKNAVEYFVSYYDYYQPEAYIPNSDTYIEKEAQINEEIDRLRHASTQAILSRRDVIVVASVSCIYNLGSPAEYEQTVLHLERGQPLNRRGMMEHLISMQFTRTPSDLKRGTFRMRGQVFELMPVNEERVYRFEIGDTIEGIEMIDPVSRKVLHEIADAWIFPAKHYVISEDLKQQAFASIRAELKERLAFFEHHGKVLEHDRLSRRTKYDLEMIEQLGYCNGIENYSRHFDGRLPGQPPYTLMEYFTHGSREFLTIIDESHMTIPQVGGMFEGDKARKTNLIEHGFRLPSAYDNRPLRFDEFEKRIGPVVYVSATPAAYERKKSTRIVEQIVRPTGLVDPEVIIRPVTGGKGNKSQVEDLVERIEGRVKAGERTLVTTLTKKMAEDLTEYLKERTIKVEYLHSEVQTLERIEIITNLRKGHFDVLVGVNLLREGLDMPEVSLVAILDGDKEGFLRSETSLVQTIGRAARNINGQVVIYADHMTGSIERALRETARRREIQVAYNKEHNITPQTIKKHIKNLLEEFGIDSIAPRSRGKRYNDKRRREVTALDLKGDTRPIAQIIADKERQMREAAKGLEFELAAILRDEIVVLKKEEMKRKK